jgi:GST-like protein
MYTAYIADTPNGRKIPIALEELGLPYRLRHVDLGAGEQFAPAFARLSPNHKIPVLVDEDADLTLFESCAILYHLACAGGRLIPADTRGRELVLQWLFMQAASTGPMLGQLWWFRHAAPAPNPQALERYTREALRLHAVAEQRLSESAYIAADEYTVADIAWYTWLATHEELGIDLQPYPHIRAWLARIAARPALRQALRKMEER